MGSRHAGQERRSQDETIEKTPVHSSILCVRDVGIRRLQAKRNIRTQILSAAAGISTSSFMNSLLGGP